MMAAAQRLNLLHAWAPVLIFAGLLWPGSTPAVAQDAASAVGETDSVKAYIYYARDDALLEDIEDALKAFGDDDDDKFQWLRQKRDEIQAMLPRQQARLRELDLQINELRAEEDRLERERRDVSEYITFSYHREKSDLDQQEASVTSKMERAQARLDAARSGLAELSALTARSDEQEARYRNLDDEVFEWQGEVTYFEEQKSDIINWKRSLENDLSRAKENSVRIEREEEVTSSALAQLQEDTAKIRDLNARTNQYVRSVDDAIRLLLVPETAENKFKLNITAAFTALVLVVILGFFIVSWKDEEVRRSIFSSQSGIQFLTLFSLVIAIILFGILEILEGKELAALLGGLSGYILGRVTSPDSSAGGKPRPSDGAAGEAGSHGDAKDAKKGAPAG
jgi:hypothetical protein